MTEDMAVSAVGTYDATANGAGSNWSMQMATFKATQGVGQTLMSDSGPVTNSTGRVKYRVSHGPLQAAGTYSTVITYTLLGTF